MENKITKWYKEKYKGSKAYYLVNGILIGTGVTLGYYLINGDKIKKILLLTEEGLNRAGKSITTIDKGTFIMRVQSESLRQLLEQSGKMDEIPVEKIKGIEFDMKSDIMKIR